MLFQYLAHNQKNPLTTSTLSYNLRVWCKLVTLSRKVAVVVDTGGDPGSSPGVLISEELVVVTVAQW